MQIYFAQLKVAVKQAYKFIQVYTPTEITMIRNNI